ncbi:MAG TPA: methyltransferase domain-containing protein [Candidatus Krumholzibacteria bacterium]|nr:methyltransferase domain-containing protein [Candidatus Krumholzibacteria bacterium]
MIIVAHDATIAEVDREVNRSADLPEPKDAPAHLAAGLPAAPGQFVLERRRRLVAPLLPAGCGHLVDIGCGNGAQTLRLADLAQRVTGVDIDAHFVDLFRRGIADAGLADRVAALVAGGSAVPLPDGAADAVTCFTVLEHVPDERAALAEMHRLLRPGGRLVLTVPNRWWLFETHGADLPLLPWNRVPLVSWWPRALHDRWARARIYRRREITALVEAAGFTVTEAFRMTAPMDVIPWAPLRRLARATLFGADRAAVPVLATEIVVAAER